MAEGQRRAEQARNRFDDPSWKTRFDIEEAKIRLYQGQNIEVIQLLNNDWTRHVSDRDAAVDRLLILAIADSRTDKKPKALESIEAVEALCTTPQKNTCKKGEIWLTEGILALQDDRLSDAEIFFNDSLKNARATEDRFLEARDLLGLSVLSLQQNHYEDALAHSQVASKIANGIGAQGTLITAQGNMGWSYYETGDYVRALTNFKDAATGAMALGEVSDEEHWLIAAGMSEAHLGELNAAGEHYRQALSLARSLNNKTEIIYVSQGLASLFLHTGHPEAAKSYIDEANGLAQLERSAFDIPLGKLLRAELEEQTGNLPQSRELALDVEQHTEQFPTTHLEAQHTLAQVCEKSGDKRQAEHWFKQSIATYREQRSQLKTDDARLPFFENGRDLYMDYVAFLIRNHRVDEALNVIDQGRAETLAEGLGYENKSDSQRPVPLKQLARQSHAIILDYALSSPSSYLWASNGKQSELYLLPDSATIQAAAADHKRALLAARDLVAEQHPATRTLYDMLVKPAEGLIHPGDRVYIVGAGGLSGLNFETLITPGPSSHYWIEDVTITHFSSLRFLAAPHPHELKPDPQPSRLLIIGNPVYTGSQYSPLPHAATEVSNVASHFPALSRRILTGAEASPDAYVRSKPASFSYIHFVSHATASHLVPLDSAVILSANGTQDSAKLYAREILSKPLNAELVTISGCQGSGVRAYAGEGLVGLAWAFLRAGSRNVIGALWDVSDVSTPELMQHLYDGIAAGKPPDVSLRDAKLELLHRRGVFRKPLYWGAFQLYSSGR